jgi:hypothetical protein
LGITGSFSQEAKNSIERISVNCSNLIICVV